MFLILREEINKSATKDIENLCKTKKENATKKDKKF